MKWVLRLLPALGLFWLFGAYLVTRDAIHAWLLTPTTPEPAAVSIEPKLKELADGNGAIGAKLDAALAKIAALEKAIGDLAEKARTPGGGWHASVRKVKTVKVGKRR